MINHSQAASPLGEHSSVVLNHWLGKGRNFEKLSMHLMLTYGGGSYVEAIRSHLSDKLAFHDRLCRDFYFY